MMHRQHILIGLLVSCSYIAPLESMEYTETNSPSTQEEIEVIEIDDADVQTYPLLQLLPKFDKEGFIEWENDPENADHSRIKLGTLVSRISHKMPILTRSQAAFLTRFEQVSFPSIIEEEDVNMLKLLGCMEFFELVETKEGTEIHPHQLLPLRKLDTTAKKRSKKRKHTSSIHVEAKNIDDQLEWQTSTNENGESIAQAKLPFILCRDREDQFKKPEQQKFLKKFKKAKLPYVIKDKEKGTFDSLKFGSFFAVEKIKAGWKISAQAPIPTKVITNER